MTVPGDTPDCDNTGAGNVQGHLLNGVAAGSVCTGRNYNYTGRFIHIEQKRCVRSATGSRRRTAVIRWETGKPATITRTSRSITDPLHLALFRDGDYDRRITKSTPNDGSFTWNVPSTLAQGATDAIRIVSTANDDIHEYSDAAIGVMRLTTTTQPVRWKPAFAVCYSSSTSRTSAWT